jgi:TonB-dependent starch-binding outer membrane protein SusC
MKKNKHDAHRNQFSNRLYGNLFLRLFCLFVLVTISSIVFGQNITIKGNVKDSQGAPLPGVAIKVQGTTLGTLTDANGNYTINVLSSKSILGFSFMGMESQKVVVGAQKAINITLNDSSVNLDEVVAIGYGKMKKRDLTGSTVSVGGAEISSIPVTTAAQAITGKVAGVNITSYSGAPGADINITIRGGTSLSQSNEPLYIVDGFQMDDALKYVDANDIQTIDVLKDASSTAIYGARGSNGVVLITTKKGAKGKTEVTYNGYVSFQKLGKKINVLSPYEYVNLQYEHYLLDNKVSIFNTLYGTYDQMHSLYDNAEAIDWMDKMYGGTGVQQNHNLTISGGNEKTRFNLSYNNTSEDALLAKYGLYKNNIRINLNHDLYKGVRLEFGSNFNDSRLEGGGDLGGKLKYCILSRPVGGLLYTNDELLNMYGADSKLLGIDTSLNYDIANPIIENDAVTNTKRTRRIDTNGSVEIDLPYNLKWKSAGSYLWQQVRSDYWDDGRTLTAETNGGPYGSRENTEKYTYQITNTLTLDKKIKQHSFTVMGGQEVVYSENMGISSESIQFTDDNFGLDDMSMGTAQTNKTSHDRSGIASFFGRAFYDYNGKYLVTTSIRADGSSNFAKGHQWGYFPSASAAWRITEEDFMKNIKVVNNLKLRLGYGTSGNCNIGSSKYLTGYTSGAYGYNNTSTVTLTPSTILGNSDLKWETIKSTDIGIDITLLNNRINLTADWYNKESSNLLMKVSIPTTTGYSYQYQNVGSIRNRGLEFVVNTANIKTKAFTWTTDFNISFNRNKVLKYTGSNIVTSGSTGAAYWIQEGQPLGQIYGYKYMGFYTSDDFTQNSNGTYTLKAGVAHDNSRTYTSIKPGDIKLYASGKTTDAYGYPTWTSDDRQVIGNANPDFTGGLTNTFTYKNFDLSIFMNFVYGNDVVNLSTQRFVSSYLANQNALSIVANRYTTVDPSTGAETTNLTRLAEINKNASIWSVNPNAKTNTILTSYNVEDGSYLRINNISLGYTLPKKWTQKAHISKARIYGTVNNIYTFTKYTGFDPEVASSSSATTPGIDDSSYPRSKSFVIGVNVGF